MNNSMRPAFFACKFGRLLTKTAAAMTISADACWLLMIVVLQEDSIKYARPVNYWNEQLQTLCGFGSKKRLVTARTKAVEAGWLEYLPGSRIKPGTYRVKLPDGIKLSDDGPCHESDLQFGEAEGGTNRNGKSDLKGARIGTANDPSGNESERQTPRKGNESERFDCPRGNDSHPKRNGKSAPSIPNPIPSSPNKDSDGSSSKKSKSKNTPEPTKADSETASYIWSLILAMQPGRKEPNLDNWADDVRLMRERDGRTDEQIRTVFEVANKHNFWRKNILSTSKLREKFDDLTLKLSVNPPKPPGGFLPPRNRRPS